MNNNLNNENVSFYPSIRCPFCSKNITISLEKVAGYEKKICPSCKRMFIAYKNKIFGFFYVHDTKII